MAFDSKLPSAEIPMHNFLINSNEATEINSNVDSFPTKYPTSGLKIRGIILLR